MIWPMATFCLLHCIADHRIALVRFVSIRQQIVRLLEIASVDLRSIYEAHEVNCVLGFELELVNFLRMNEDVMAFGVLIALHDFFFRDFREGRRHALLSRI